MSHDLEASYASAELAAHWLANPDQCFAMAPEKTKLSAWAAREGRNSWPHADGVIELDVTGGKRFSVAVEFKRPNEGLHGILTAIGQAHAYLRKGYAGSVIVIPNHYSGLSNSAAYVREVLDLTSKAEGVGVYGYSAPDMTLPSPFSGKLLLGRRLKVDAVEPIDAPVQLARTETQWAHVREGSSDPDAFFRYLQSVKLVGGDFDEAEIAFPKQIRSAVKKVSPFTDIAKYLSNAPGDQVADKAWRHFWYQRVLYSDAIVGWVKNGTKYVVNDKPLKVLRSDGKGQKRFFSARTDSIKNRLVKSLNSKAITETEALKRLVQNYHDRAHSYREDIDSGAEHFGFVDSEGRLTDLGYAFVDACERTGDPNNGLAKAIFMSAVLREGGLGAFLHYVYRLSENIFSKNALDFSVKRNGKRVLDSSPYLQRVELEMAQNLHVMRKVSARGGVARKPFQAELAMLRNLGIVGSGFRLGVGMIINWPAFQDALEFSNRPAIQS
jgi:hypothetical protein